MSLRHPQLTLVTCFLMWCAFSAHADGILTTESLGNGEYFVTGISGTLFGTPVSLLSTTNPVPNPNPSQCPMLPQFYEDAVTGFEYDDIIYFPGFAEATNACQTHGLLVDEGGLGLEAGGTGYNIIGLSQAYDFFSTGYYVADSNGNFYQVSFSVAAAGPDAFTWTISQSVPEPAALTLFGLGLLGLAWVRRRRYR